MKRTRIPESRDLHPNLTPLIDVVMCLIIFYMLAARIGVATGAAKEITLPESVQGVQIADLGNTVTLNVMEPVVSTEDLPRVTLLDPGTGEMRDLEVRNFRTGRNDLEDFLKIAKSQNPALKAIIRADADLDYRFLEPVLIACEAAKMESMNFATRKAGQSIE